MIAPQINLQKLSDLRLRASEVIHAFTKYEITYILNFRFQEGVLVKVGRTGPEFFNRLKQHMTSFAGWEVARIFITDDDAKRQEDWLKAFLFDYRFKNSPEQFFITDDEYFWLENFPEEIMHWADPKEFSKLVPHQRLAEIASRWERYNLPRPKLNIL